MLRYLLEVLRQCDIRPVRSMHAGSTELSNPVDTQLAPCHRLEASAVDIHHVADRTLRAVVSSLNRPDTDCLRVPEVNAIIGR
eukprot:6659469-Prymnesium_polylepis.1